MSSAAAHVRRLSLSNFRSYQAATLELEGGAVVLFGANGAGKTNVLEAISLLGPGRGLRRARLEELAAHSGDGNWAVAAEVEGALGPVSLGTGVERNRGAMPARKFRIDREPASSGAAFADHLRVVWLVPAMDLLFAGPPAERRRFLDRLALALDANHAGRVNALERSLRSRNRLLEERKPDPRWLAAVEHEMAELAVAVAAQRVSAARQLTATLLSTKTAAFPWAEIAVQGTLEIALMTAAAADVEEGYRGRLHANRARDAAARRTLEGPHVSDLSVTYGPNGLPAASTSTGEQKALLINLVLAHARLVAATTGSAPVVLLDEVAAHLDPVRRAALYEALGALGAQVFMTGADPLLFAELGARAQHFRVAPGVIERVGSSGRGGCGGPSRGTDSGFCESLRRGRQGP